MKKITLFLALISIFAEMRGATAVYMTSTASGNSSQYNITTNLYFPSGKLLWSKAGSTLTLDGVMQGTPSGGTLNLSNLSLTLPAAFNIPSQTGQAGKVLSTNGTTMSWVTGGGGGSYSFVSPLVDAAGSVSIPSASESVNGYLSSTNFTIFNNKESAITPGTTGQYWRGDKTWQTLDKAAVGLSNVDNTADASKPVSTATQTALNAKENSIAATTSADYWRGDKTFQPLNKAAVGLGNVDNTSDASKPVSTATQTALNAKYGNIVVSGQSSLSASTTTGDLTMVAGSGITITTNAGTNAITFTATGGGSGTVTSSGSPTSGQVAVFTTATNITGNNTVGSGNIVRDTNPTINGATFTGTINFADIATTNLTATNLLGATAHGQIYIGNVTNGQFTKGVVTGTNITVTNGAGSIALSLPTSGVAAGTYGSATAVPVIVVDNTGRITSSSNATVTPAVGDILGLGTGAAAALAANTNASGGVTTPDGTATLTNKTFDAAATGNVFKAYGYLQLTHPTVFASGTIQQITVTDRRYGQALFGNATDKATNYVEYLLTVPDDLDTSVDLTAVFHFNLGGADTGDFEYEISMIDVPASSVYDTAPADAVSLTFTADGSGADKDVQKTTSTTLTGWAAALTPGSVWYVRVARDGDHANDTSTVNSYSGPLVIRYGITQ